MRRVGILGGMGPEATILLMQKVLAAIPATDDADHIPLLVDQNPQVPSRIRHLIEGTGEDPSPILVAMAWRLQGAGAEALAMPCITAHAYLDQIRAATSLAILDMVALSVDHASSIARHKNARIGILASPAVRRVGLFDAPFVARGFSPLHPKDETCILNTIRQIKSHGPVPEAQEALVTLAKDLVAEGADVLMIACTELSLLAPAVREAVQAQVPVFDTLDVLVGAIISFATAAEGAIPENRIQTFKTKQWRDA